MAYDSSVVLDQVAQSQSGHDIQCNNVFKALSAAALFGIRQSATSGLIFTVYGGVFNIAGVPTVLSDQAITLTASATNYIYTTSAGVVTKVTSAPTGWPGPITSPAGAIALYQLTVGASTITSGTNYRIGVAAAGAQGSTGAQGAPGPDFPSLRIRVRTTLGSNTTTVHEFGWTNTGTGGTGITATAVALASSSLRASIPYLSYVTAAGAGSGGGITEGADWCFLGNAAGRGGFTLALRFCMESATSPANQRSLFGIFANQTIGNVEPDTLVSLCGIAAKAGDANFSTINNDASGTATMTTLGSNFPARATDNVYELLLTSAANSSVIAYTLTEVSSGNAATGTFTTNIPANTQFLRSVMWTNNGSTASAASFGLMQAVGETRY